MQRLKKRLPPRPRAAKQTQKVEESKPLSIPTEAKQQRNSERRKSRPFGGRKNKEGREKAIEDHRAVSIDYSISIIVFISICYLCRTQYLVVALLEQLLH